MVSLQIVLGPGMMTLAANQLVLMHALTMQAHALSDASFCEAQHVEQLLQLHASDAPGLSQTL